VGEVGREPVGHVDQGARAALGEPARRRDARLGVREAGPVCRVRRLAGFERPQRAQRPAEPAGDVERVAGARTGAAHRAGGRAEHGEGHAQRRPRGEVAADDRRACRPRRRADPVA
jgi:hypothetical protein